MDVPAKPPSPAALTHLRASDLRGALAVAMAASITAIAIWLSAAGGWAPWIAGQLLMGVALVQWFAILHECGHDTLFRRRRLNTIAGTAAGMFALIPFRCWRRVHGRHHKWVGWQDLDPTTAALVPRPLSRGERTIVNVCWRCWLPLFSILYRVQNFWNLPRLFRMFPAPQDRRAMLRDSLVLVGVLAGVTIAVGPSAMARVAGLGLLVSLMLEDLLLLSQHTHIPQHVSGGGEVAPFPAIEQAAFTRSLRLPRWASEALLHFDAHELHHMYPFVPGYRLGSIAWQADNEVGALTWVRAAKQLRGEVLLFQNRTSTGWDL
jgi:acyl-lipid omega-6 desaturase (Delta-12 desaturase)